MRKQTLQQGCKTINIKIAIYSLIASSALRVADVVDAVLSDVVLLDAAAVFVGFQSKSRNNRLEGVKRCEISRFYCILLFRS
ncbi:Hypothetical predicted protein [Octopus vulgaris]|uniref:Uncharacterized protein n=1 Tax=Octopus vulgaris TaxID=6645 RepID=A0AA36BJN5_OCTVU|nr:Hypothetical predicted protein [Octopus vulgaris]